ncbi:pentapeptide repeat-containing protein [Thalassospira lucentensis]|uniref:pentapeptide repeat-containing protein n=1 Tax=Thalassospira lucentensis TaxID=168935 RepID=UPI003D2EB31B
MAINENNKKTILYADYSERNMLAANSAIEPMGFSQLVHCDDRERTVELVHELKPDLIMIGLYLDGMRGISTIRAIRDSATASDRHARDVPVLLGAPKLDRRGMRDAVNAGIEGIFRQPVDPKRLRKIIETVLAKPRRFVLEENYFGPARPQDLAKMGISAPDQNNDASSSKNASTDDAEAVAENPGRRRRDHMIVSPSAPTARAASPEHPVSTALSAHKPTPAASAAPKTTQKSPIKGVAENLELAAVKPRLNGAGQTFDDGELVGVPTARAKDSRAQNIQAIKSAREIIAPTPVPAPEEPAAEPEEELDTETDVDTDELVEIDLQEALISHKLWVDTGGKEGAVMSIEHADLREAELEGIDLSRCGLPFASFKRANCKDAVLRRCNLIAADFIESNLANTNLAASRLAGARFNDAMLRNTVFLGSDLSNASFRGQQLVNCDLSGTNLAGTDFRDADLSGTRGLFAEQIQRARVNANTRLPHNLKLRD